MKNIIILNIIGAAIATAVLLPLALAPSQAHEIDKDAIYQAANESPEKLRLLLNQGGSINAVDTAGDTALMHAATQNNEAAAQRLIDNGADVNARNEHGETALIQAAETGSVDVVCLLLSVEADLNIRDDEGKTALQKAAEADHADIAGIIGRAGGQ